MCTAAGEENEGARAGQRRACGRRGGGSVVGGSARRVGGAISRNGHTLAGRVRQKSHKCAELVSAGSLR